MRNLQKKKKMVDIHRNPRDHECVLLAAQGYSNQCIRRLTGLTDGMIAYRLYQKANKCGISRMDFRNGVGILSEALMQHNRKVADRVLIAHLKKYL